jgi:hypothetical protein
MNTGEEKKSGSGGTPPLRPGDSAVKDPAFCIYCGGQGHVVADCPEQFRSDEDRAALHHHKVASGDND